MTSIVLGGYISVLTNHVMNMVLPKMMSDLGTDVITIRWVVTAYMIANAVVMPLSAWLARTLGARDLYIGCLFVFIGSTVACGMATSVPMIVIFRVIQGASGGLLMPVSMFIMLDLYPAEKRGLGTSIWSMGASCGSLTGIPLGGFVAEHLSWRAAFYLILPAGVIALFIACFIMRKSPRERGIPFDWWGVLTLSTAMVALMLALSNGQRDGWNSTPIVSLLLVFALALGAFLLIEPHAKTPVVDLRAFRSPQYAIGIGLCFIAGAMFNGGPFLLSLFLQRMYDFSVQDAAMIMFPSSAFLVLLTPISGWASDRIDARYLMTLGYLFYAVFGLYMMFADLRLSASGSPGHLFWPWPGPGPVVRGHLSHRYQRPRTSPRESSDNVAQSLRHPGWGVKCLYAGRAHRATSAGALRTPGRDAVIVLCGHAADTACSRGHCHADRGGSRTSGAC